MRSPPKNVIVMAFLGSITLVLSLLVQAEVVPSFSGDILSPKEKTKMEKANSVNNRIKIYESASKRIQKELHEAVSKDKSKKKSRNLIHYEIQVRKSIAAMQDYKLQAPVDQQDDFDACLAQAETVHKRFVEILFKH
jgi:hypothetical protein